MFYRTIILIAFTWFANLSLGQEAVANWQEDHPHVLFMTFSTFENLDNDMQSTVANKVILFEENPSLSDILAFEEAHTNVLSAQKPIMLPSIDGGTEIKNWLGQHPGMKIIRHSEFINIDKDERAIYINDDNTLILENEFVTLKDIEHYEATH